MQEETTEQPGIPEKPDGKISQVLLSVKSAGASYGSFTNSISGSDISSLTSIDEADHMEAHDTGNLYVVLLIRNTSNYFYFISVQIFPKPGFYFLS